MTNFPYLISHNSKIFRGWSFQYRSYRKNESNEFKEIRFYERVEFLDNVNNNTGPLNKRSILFRFSTYPDVLKLNPLRENSYYVTFVRHILIKIQNHTIYIANKITHKFLSINSYLRRTTTTDNKSIKSSYLNPQSLNPKPIHSKFIYP